MPRLFPAAADFRGWLAQHSAEAIELIVGFRKKVAANPALSGLNQSMKGGVSAGSTACESASTTPRTKSVSPNANPLRHGAFSTSRRSPISPARAVCSRPGWQRSHAARTKNQAANRTSSRRKHRYHPSMKHAFGSIRQGGVSFNRSRPVFTNW